MDKRKGLPSIVMEMYCITDPKYKKKGSYFYTHLNKLFHDEYPEKEWKDLDEAELNTFLYVTIRKKMLETYTDSSQKTNVIRKLREEAKHKPMLTDSYMAPIECEYNKNNDKIWRTYGTESMFEHHKYYEPRLKEIYKEFKADYKEVIGSDSVPSYKEWRDFSLKCLENYKAAKEKMLADGIPEEEINLPKLPRLYDYIMSIEEESRGDESGNVASTTSIDSTQLLLEIICHIIKEELHIEILHDQISEVCNFMNSYQMENFEPVDLSTPPKGMEDAENIKKWEKDTKIYLLYDKMLKDLSNFYIKTEEKPDSKTRTKTQNKSGSSR